MIAIVHQNGTSFKGLMSYLLTGKDGTEHDRVDWTHTENLGTDNPRHATALMIATSKMQHELKASAGIRNTGRKSGEVVQHITLSWAENEDVSKSEMLAAARGALTYLGVAEGEKLNKKQVAKRTQYADQHQVVMVAHKDRTHKHVHLCINRVHPGHGVMLPENKKFEKFSAWALDLRRAMGKEDLCPQRAINAAKRAAGLLTKHPRKPRNVYENQQEQRAADPGSRKRALLDEQERRGKALKAKTEQLKATQAAERKALQDALVKAEKDERSASAEHVRRTRMKIKSSYVSKITDLQTRQARDRQRFDRAKATLAGRVRNTWSVLKTKAWMSEIRTSPLKATTQALGLAFNSGLQQAQLETYHEQEQRKLKTQMRKDERAAATAERARLAEKLKGHRDQYTPDRTDLLFVHTMAQAKLKAEWRQLDRERRMAMNESGRAPEAERAMGEGSGRSGKDSAMQVPASPRAEAERAARGSTTPHRRRRTRAKSTNSRTTSSPSVTVAARHAGRRTDQLIVARAAAEDGTKRPWPIQHTAWVRVSPSMDRSRRSRRSRSG